MNQTLPTASIEQFKEHLKNPNKSYLNGKQQNTAIRNIQKNIVISYQCDSSGCGHIRNVFPMTYLNACFGKSRQFNLLLSPQAMIMQDDILMRTRSIFFQRTMAPQLVPLASRYKELQKKFKFKMVYDIDDFIWDGPEDGETIPEYNFGKKSISHQVQQACVDIMKQMDIVCVSSKYLGDYISTKGIDKKKIEVVHNTIPQYFWGNTAKPHIKTKIKKPKVLWSASPTHWSNELRLAGDMDNAWLEWVMKSVVDGKIDYYQMGGLPWFFEPIKDKINVIPWLNSYQYHLTVMNIKPDFGISPLVPNFFNYSKSYIKYQEFCAVGAVGIGTVFTNGKMSPYDICKVQVPDNITVSEIDDVFKKYCEPKEYNKVLDGQYRQMIENHWYTESKGYIDKLMKIL